MDRFESLHFCFLNHSRNPPKKKTSDERSEDAITVPDFRRKKFELQVKTAAAIEASTMRRLFTSPTFYQKKFSTNTFLFSTPSSANIFFAPVFIT